jgi:hypothetical protein
MPSELEKTALSDEVWEEFQKAKSSSSRLSAGDVSRAAETVRQYGEDYKKGGRELAKRNLSERVTALVRKRREKASLPE